MPHDHPRRKAGGSARAGRPGGAGQLEGEPGESITDPWVSERVTLVAEQDARVGAAAHLLRYGSGAGVGVGAGESYRGLGEIRWLLFWPQAPAGNPHWADASTARPDDDGAPAPPAASRAHRVPARPGGG